MENTVKCTRCGADARVKQEKVSTTPKVVWVGYALVMAVMTYMVYHYGTMPATSNTSGLMFAFIALWVACLVVYPIIMSRVYPKRDATVVRCSTCGHVERVE